MPRLARTEYPGATYHVFARGHDRRKMFLDDSDHFSFLSRLERIASRHHWNVPVYCLMGNHYHLVVETPDGNLTVGMRDLNSSYCQRFNQRHERQGPLLQGRYGAIVVEDDAYFLGLARYVLRNPVRAGLCGRPDDWRWSSYAGTVVPGRAPAFANPSELLALFDCDPDAARRSFAEFVSLHDDKTVWSPQVSSELSRSLGRAPNVKGV